MAINKNRAQSAVSKRVDGNIYESLGTIYERSGAEYTRRLINEVLIPCKVTDLLGLMEELPSSSLTRILPLVEGFDAENYIIMQELKDARRRRRNTLKEVNGG